MLCDRCDRGYHTYCVGLEASPDGSWQCSACDAPNQPTLLSSPTPVNKPKRGRPLGSRYIYFSWRKIRSCAKNLLLISRLSSPQQTISSPKTDGAPTRVSSRRGRPAISTPLSPSHNINQSSNSSSTDLPTTNSSSMSLILSRHQQQWTTTPTISTEIKSKTWFIRPINLCMRTSFSLYSSCFRFLCVLLCAT